MFSKILIANRGEIACRIIESAQHLGVATVAVYSDADAGARHVEMADEAVHIGGALAAESYLDGNSVIAAAIAAGAEAIHPGYGFLSENPEFVTAIEAAGLVFIGPSADAISAMGLKDAAKTLMTEAGVPVVPGYQGDDQTLAHLAARAAEIGYPVLVKAVAGGGGKGMRRVDRADDFDAALGAAQNEARASFGNDAVLIEKYIQSPRHIEVQVFGDTQGNIVHLFERDCSLQRRHQKVIEEAPAPGMTPELRAAMGAAAVQAARAVGYVGAGTVEFIVDASDGLHADRFWFMEMNTRLQVEHPVTEAITGVDLVEWQLRVAAGEPLPLQQDELSISGHAFEARLYAEDASNGFLPATGQLTHLKFPTGARADSGVRTGDAISPYYDPMIAKLVTHGPTRAIALARLTRALEDTEVAGCVTNLSFLAALSRHEGFAAGNVDTGLIERDLEGLTATTGGSSRALALAAASLFLGGAGFTLWEPLTQSVAFRIDGSDVEVLVTTHSCSRFYIAVEGTFYWVEKRRDGWWVDDDKAGVEIVQSGQSVSVFGKTTHSFTLVDPLDVEPEAALAGNVIAAPMPGLVKAVFVAAGDNVSKGDALAVLEAMKMEHQLLAARDGVVAEVLAAADAQVEAGAPLFRLEEEA